MIVVAAEEVSNGVGTALERHAAANWLPGRERRAEPARNVILDQVEVLDDAIVVSIVDTLIELLRTR